MRKTRKIVTISMSALLMVSILLPVLVTIGTTTNLAYLPQFTPIFTKKLATTPVFAFEGPTWFIEDSGTCFKITGSDYLNITLKSSNSVHVILESVPKMVGFLIESINTETSAVLTLSGFDPLTTYYRYQDGCLIESFTTDMAGKFIYTQDLSKPHHVYIQEEPSTLKISTDFTFTENINEAIVIEADNIVIDGNGYTLQDSGTYGIYLYGRSNVTIKNLNIKGWICGIFLWDCLGSTISGNNITGNQYYGISIPYSSNNEISENLIAKNGWYGLADSHSSKNDIFGNNLTKNKYGIRTSYSLNNSISENYLIKNKMVGIDFSYSSNNIIFHNNFINNTKQANDRSPSDNYWHHPVLLEGNYWFDYPGVDNGSGIDKHSIADDGIGDTNIPWPQTNYDLYPYMEENGWKKEEGENFEGFGMLRIDRQRFIGEANLLLSENIIEIEISEQKATWDILYHYEEHNFEFFYGTGDLGKIVLMIYREDTSYAVAIGRKVFFYGQT